MNLLTVNFAEKITENISKREKKVADDFARRRQSAEMAQIKVEHDLWQNNFTVLVNL